MSRAALYTFNSLKAPFFSTIPAIRQFQELGREIYGGIAEADGYIAHAAPADWTSGQFENDWGPWGEFAVPRWYEGSRTADGFAAATTLSLWADVESARDFAYTGLHRTALARRQEWFQKTDGPVSVLWWTSDGGTPTWGDGVERLESLADRGPQPDAFTFRHAFSPAGTESGR